MKHRALKKLNRSQLLEIMSEQSEEIDKLNRTIRMRCMENDELPNTSDINGEISRVDYKRKYKRTLRSTVGALIIVAAIAVLVATLWLPVFQTYGNSMAPTLNSDEIVVAVKTDDVEKGDVIAFYYNNKVLIKRVIAQSGDWVDIDKDGNVSVNGETLDEPYVNEKSYGECDIEFPYQVPDDRVFVLGDNRGVSVDSRNSSMGCVSDEQIVGKLIFKIWPLKSIGTF
jgi:signal peptidase I